MKGIAAAAFFATALLAGAPALAEAVRYVQGRVLSATPIVQLVRTPVTREVCYDEEVLVRRNSATPTILGAIIGGVVGNQFGDGSGRTAMTVAGAALGGSIGNDAARRRAGPASEFRRRCEPVTESREEERIVGYRVEYEYDGQVYTTRTGRDPGATIELRVSVSPVGPGP